MAKNRRVPTRRAVAPTVTVCRGCCCGTTRKHPGIDHAAQVVELTAGIGDAGSVRVSDCLDACERSNVVVVGPSRDGKLAGARPVWLSGVLDPDTVADVVAWVRAGGPGVGDPPNDLDLAAFMPTRRSRLEIGEF